MYSYGLWTVPRATVAVLCHVPAWKGYHADRNEQTENDRETVKMGTVELDPSYGRHRKAIGVA
jgi:hypothetical protein